MHLNGMVRQAPAGQSQARVEVEGKCQEEHKADEVSKQNDHLGVSEDNGYFNYDYDYDYDYK